MYLALCIHHILAHTGMGLPLDLKRSDPGQTDFLLCMSHFTRENGSEVALLNYSHEQQRRGIRYVLDAVQTTWGQGGGA